MEFKCKKWESTTYETKEKSNGTGIAIGLYCAECGQWHKWIPKSEIDKYKPTEKPQDELPEELTIDGITYRRCNMNCPNCGSKLDTGFNCPICGYSPEKQLVAVPKPEPSIAENEEEEEENE